MTLVSWMIYALAMGTLLAAAARLLEQGLSAVRAPTRWVWLAALLLSVGLPAVAALRAPAPEPPRPMVDVPLVVDVTAPVEAPRAGGTWATFVARTSSAFAAPGRALDRGLAALATATPQGASRAWILGLWIAASGLLAAVLLGTLARLGAKAGSWPQSMLRGRVVRVSPDFGPATLGLLRPQIVVPRWAAHLPADDLDLVLAHEEEHARARDPLLQAVGLLALVACPWNPLVWWQLRRLGHAVEVDCDRRVLARGVSAPRYADLLVQVGGRAARGVLAATSMASTPSLLERRLRAMRRTRPRSALPRAAGGAAAAALLVLVAASATPSALADQQDPRASAAPDRRENLLMVWLERDGTVLVNDAPHGMDDVSEVVRPLVAAGGGELLVYVTGYPYHSLRLQRELLAAGVAEVATSLDPLIRVRLPSTLAMPVAPIAFPPGVTRAFSSVPSSPSRAPSAATGSLPAATLTSQERRISINFRDAPLELVLTAFSRLSGRTIAAAEGVSASIDADIVDQPWDEALRSILADHGLVGVQDRDGNIRVERREAALARVERDIRVLEAAWNEVVRGGGLRIEALQESPAAMASSELGGLLSDLVTARQELGVLRDRYSDDYPPIQDLLREIVVIESNYIPRVLDGLLAQLEIQAAELRG